VWVVLRINWIKICYNYPFQKSKKNARNQARMAGAKYLLSNKFIKNNGIKLELSRMAGRRPLESQFITKMR